MVYEVALLMLYFGDALAQAFHFTTQGKLLLATCILFLNYAFLEQLLQLISSLQKPQLLLLVSVVPLNSAAVVLFLQRPLLRLACPFLGDQSFLCEAAAVFFLFGCEKAQIVLLFMQ